MTRRKDAQPETSLPETSDLEVQQPDSIPTEPFVAEVVVEPAPATSPDQGVQAEGDPVPQSPLAPRRPGIFGPLIGGALAAIGGFALSHFNVFGLDTSSADVVAIAARLDEAATQQTTAQQTLGADIDAISKRVAALESASPGTAPDLSRLDALDQRLAAIEAIPADGTASTAALTAKIEELEQRLTALPTVDASPELEQKLNDALARLTEAETSATAREAEADAAATTAVRDKALDALGDTVGSGQPFTAELQALADPALSELLGPMAETGVPTLSTLQETFPEAARQALQTARDLGSQDGWGDRLMDFLAAQTGARPLTPLVGDTPEAILSRAEYALSEARVSDALAELDPLDPAVKAPIDPWIAQAQAYLVAAAALQAARGE